MHQPLTGNARALRKNQTDAELELWRKLRDRQIDGWKFKRQVPCGPYIADFFCVDASLVIEVDGNQHFETRAGYGARRTAFLKLQGQQVLRFLER